MVVSAVLLPSALAFQVRLYREVCYKQRKTGWKLLRVVLAAAGLSAPDKPVSKSLINSVLYLQATADGIWFYRDTE